jgi:hypothetical protein
MRKTLTSVVRDTAPKNGNGSPLSQESQLNIRDCLVIISNRETELAQLTGRALDEKPQFADEPKTAHTVSITGLGKKTH